MSDFVCLLVRRNRVHVCCRTIQSRCCRLVKCSAQIAALSAYISKRKTLRSGSPHSPCAPDVPCAYNVNSCSRCVRPGSFRPHVRGLRPDAFDPPWGSHPTDTLPPAPSLFIPSLPMHPFPCCPFADILRPQHLSFRPPLPIGQSTRFPSMIPSLL